MLASTRLSAENRSDLAAAMLAVYQAEGCGICQERGADVFWFSPYSRGAHQNCYDKIKPVEENLMKVIHDICVNDTDYSRENRAHTVALCAIKKAIPTMTIKTFYRNHGAKKLQSLFDQVGIKAVWKYAASEGISASITRPNIKTKSWADIVKRRAF